MRDTFRDSSGCDSEWKTFALPVGCPAHAIGFVMLEISEYVFLAFTFVESYLYSKDTSFSVMRLAGPAVYWPSQLRKLGSVACQPFQKSYVVLRRSVGISVLVGFHTTDWTGSVVDGLPGLA